MQQFFDAVNNRDDNGAPAGGHVFATGVSIHWQNGPLGRGDERKEPNGAFVETLIAIIMHRLNFYQSTQFSCQENGLALAHLHSALTVLNSRTASREQRGVEGTHEI